MPPKADLLIINAHVFTSNPHNPYAEAVAVSGNQIVFVGSYTDAKDW